MPVSLAQPTSSSAGMKKFEAGVTPSAAQTSSLAGLLRHREALLGRSPEDERLVAELVEGGAELAGDDALSNTYSTMLQLALWY